MEYRHRCIDSLFVYVDCGLFAVLSMCLIDQRSKDEAYDGMGR